MDGENNGEKDEVRDGEKIKSQKRRKKIFFEDLTLLVVPNGSI